MLPNRILIKIFHIGERETFVSFKLTWIAIVLVFCIRKRQEKEENLLGGRKSYEFVRNKIKNSMITIQLLKTTMTAIRNKITVLRFRYTITFGFLFLLSISNAIDSYPTSTANTARGDILRQRPTSSSSLTTSLSPSLPITPSSTVAATATVVAITPPQGRNERTRRHGHRRRSNRKNITFWNYSDDDNDDDTGHLDDSDRLFKRETKTISRNSIQSKNDESVSESFKIAESMELASTSLSPSARKEKEQVQRRRKGRRTKASVQLNKRSTVLDNEEYQRRKNEWRQRYATVEGLREQFGKNRNKFFGDLDTRTTRQLYKSLLPTAVCELVLDVDVRPDELAPLAYEARKAAKLYARERCYIPARWFAHIYDGYRQFRKYGKFQVQGMSYDQLFDKYYERSALERQQQQQLEEDVCGEDGDDEDILSEVCMKILESACRTNPLIDQMTIGTRQKRRKKSKRKKRRRRGKNKTQPHRQLLNNSDLNTDDTPDIFEEDDSFLMVYDERENLERIAKTLEDGVYKLLNPDRKSVV